LLEFLSKEVLMMYIVESEMSEARNRHIEDFVRNLMPVSPSPPDEIEVQVLKTAAGRFFEVLESREETLTEDELCSYVISFMKSYNTPKMHSIRNHIKELRLIAAEIANEALEPTATAGRAREDDEASFVFGTFEF